MKQGALLLAAGFSNRFGRLKLAEPLTDGRTIFEHTLSNMAQSVTDILVISRPEVAPLLEPIIKSLDLSDNVTANVTANVTRGNGSNVSLIVFSDAELGMGSTLAFGAQHIEDWDSCLICLADMPFIDPATYSKINAELDRDTIVIPYYQNKAGNPVGFGASFFPALGSLRGDAGGRQIIKSNAGQVRKIEFDDPALLMDIDTPEDVQRYQPS